MPMDVVPDVPLKVGCLRQQDRSAVDSCADVALALQILKQILVFTLATLNNRCQDRESRTLWQTEDPINDTVPSLRPNGRAAGDTMRFTYAREQNPEIVVDLRHRADGRSRVPASGLLLDRDSRRETRDAVYIWLLELSEKLSSISREGLYISSLTFGIDGVEGHR